MALANGTPRPKHNWKICKLTKFELSWMLLASAGPIFAFRLLNIHYVFFIRTSKIFSASMFLQSWPKQGSKFLKIPPISASMFLYLGQIKAQMFLVFQVSVAIYTLYKKCVNYITFPHKYAPNCASCEWNTLSVLDFSLNVLRFWKLQPRDVLKMFLDFQEFEPNVLINVVLIRKT